MVWTRRTPRGRGLKEPASGGKEVTRWWPPGKESDTGTEGYMEETGVNKIWSMNVSFNISFPVTLFHQIKDKSTDFLDLAEYEYTILDMIVYSVFNLFLCWPSPQAQVMFHFGQNINIVLVLYNINFMDAGRMVKCNFILSCNILSKSFWCKYIYIYSRVFNKVFLIDINPIPLSTFMLIKGGN